MASCVSRASYYQWSVWLLFWLPLVAFDSPWWLPHYFSSFFFTVTEPATQTVGLSSVQLPTAVCDPVCHRRWFRAGPDVAQIFLSAFHWSCQQLFDCRGSAEGHHAPLYVKDQAGPLWRLPSNSLQIASMWLHCGFIINWSTPYGDTHSLCIYLIMVRLYSYAGISGRLVNSCDASFGKMPHPWARLTCRPMGPGGPGNPLDPSSPFWPNMPCQ